MRHNVCSLKCPENATSTLVRGMDPPFGEDNVREQRLQRGRERERNLRASESNDVRQRRLALRRERERNRRASEGDEVQQTRLALRRERDSSYKGLPRDAGRERSKTSKR